MRRESRSLAEIVGSQRVGPGRALQLRRGVDLVDGNAPDEQSRQHRERTIGKGAKAENSAILWRRKRRHASCGEALRLANWAYRGRLSGKRCGSQATIEDVCNEVEDDDQAEPTRRSTPMTTGVSLANASRRSAGADTGNAEDLFGDDRAAEYDRHLQRDQRHDRDQGGSHHVPGDDLYARRSPWTVPW